MKFTIMILFGIVGTLTWTLAGQLIQNFYSARYRGINLIVSALLVFSAYDLWR